MASSRTKTGLRRVFVLPLSKQIGVLEEYTTTFEDEVVKVEGIDRYINPGDDLSGEDELTQLIANTYFNTL
tara:strand:+ start:364 stop:576 length:213 start_codon:yes stop_codon:yes gene_type:complete